MIATITVWGQQTHLRKFFSTYATRSRRRVDETRSPGEIAWGASQQVRHRIAVVDIGILKLLEAIRTTKPGAHVVLASHDGSDFAAALRPLLDEKRKVTLLGLREYVSQRFREFVPAGLEILDLEMDAKVFQRPLPRLLPIRVDDFDAASFL